MKKLKKFEILQREVLALSLSSNWFEAISEWDILNPIFRPSGGICLCSHRPIFQICRIKNDKTGKLAEVGSCCIQHFMGLSSNNLFLAYKRVSSDRTKTFDETSLTLARKNDVINGWEYDFYLDTKRKRSLSSKQMQCRRKINVKILLFFEENAIEDLF